MRKFYIITLFPEFIEAFKKHSMIFKAEKNNIIKVIPIDLRKFGIGDRKTVDGTPAGGGGGMILRVDVIKNAIDSIRNKNNNICVILLDPRGEIFNQKKSIEITSSNKDIVLICGHYEGVDDRINNYIDNKLSVGKFVLTGGEIPAMVVVDAVSRNIKGFFGEKSPQIVETFKSENYHEFPQFTKPLEFDGKKIPEILLSGNHGEIEKWRSSNN